MNIYTKMQFTSLQWLQQKSRSVVLLLELQFLWIKQVNERHSLNHMCMCSFSLKRKKEKGK